MRHFARHYPYHSCCSNEIKSKSNSNSRSSSDGVADCENENENENEKKKEPLPFALLAPPEAKNPFQSPIKFFTGKAAKQFISQDVDMYQRPKTKVIYAFDFERLEYRVRNVVPIRNAELDYQLVEFHFHSPGEHVINEERFVLEAHFVFASDPFSKLFVLGFPIQLARGDKSPLPRNKRGHRHPPPLPPPPPSQHQYSPFQKRRMGRGREGGGGGETTTSRVLKLIQEGKSILVPNLTSFFSTTGSLTVDNNPEATEKSIQWYVSATALRVTRKDLGFFQSIGKAARPLNDRNGRAIVYVHPKC